MYRSPAPLPCFDRTTPLHPTPHHATPAPVAPATPASVLAWRPARAGVRRDARRRHRPSLHPRTTSHPARPTPITSLAPMRVPQHPGPSQPRHRSTSTPAAEHTTAKASHPVPHGPHSSHHVRRLTPMRVPQHPGPSQPRQRSTPTPAAKHPSTAIARVRSAPCPPAPSEPPRRSPFCPKRSSRH